jgi:holo-[acyl-carrier protein] synthase
MRLVLRTGIDLLQIDRFAAVYARHGMRFIRRIFTPGEQEASAHRVTAYATRWAAKEATAKMLGVGLRGLGSGVQAVGWTTIEVTHDELRKPLIRLHGESSARAHVLGIDTIDVSVSHDAGFVVVSVVGAGLVSDMSEA